MEKLKIKFHWSFIVLGVLLIYFKEYILLLCMVSSTLLHELGHFIVANKLGYRLNIINLMPYGASLSGEEIYIDNKHEFFIALAGPLTSLLIAIIIIALWWVFPTIYYYTETFVYANLSLFLVNLLPCYPLDGSRMLCSIFTQKRKFIQKFLSVTTIILLMVLYIVSCFIGKTNYTLCMFTIFLTIGLFFNENVEKYSYKSKTFTKNIKLKKGIKVNIKAISSESTLMELYKILDPTSLNYILILWKDNDDSSTTLTDKQIEKILIKYSLNTTISKAIKEEKDCKN